MWHFDLIFWPSQISTLLTFVGLKKYKVFWVSTIKKQYFEISIDMTKKLHFALLDIFKFQNLGESKASNLKFCVILQAFVLTFLD